VAEAKQRGLKFDEKTAREQTLITALTVKTYRQRFLDRVDHPAGSAPSTGYIALGLAAEDYPADENTDAMIIELAGRQHLDGSWTAFGHRPPLEYSRISATALAVRALQLYGPPGMKPRLQRQIDKARAWLQAASPASNSDRAFKLLGLSWAGGEPQEIEAEVHALEKQQRQDGGWAQQPSMESDAYATGLTMFALHTGGNVSTDHPSYERGVQYLLGTQLDDGSWHVKSRSFPFQPYFESGFPHGHDQWISAMATGFATVALVRTLPAKGDVGR
jgi:squalene cyclase